MPVEGFSPAVTLTAPMALSPQLIITGGRNAEGLLTSDTYGYDGTEWMKLSISPMPKALEGLAVAPYYSLRNKNIEWRVDVFPTLLAFGGREADGKVNKVVYMSRDWGMHWQKADSLLQPAPEFPAVYGAQVPVVEHTFSARTASTWFELPDLRMPVGARRCGAGQSRIAEAIEEWNAPYIYLFGGYDESGRLNTTVWRGVINRFTFKPIE